MGNVKPTLKQILRYKFDNLMARGSIALIGWLGLISFTIVILSAVILIFSGIRPPGAEKLSFFEAFWQSLMRTLSSGNVGKDIGWEYRITMLIVTLGGIFVVSTLIGILNNGIRKKLDSLSKARSLVIESDHTLILGWSSKIFSIVNELIIANESEKNPKIVVLANKEKSKMEDEIKSRVKDFKNTKIILRTGNPLDIDDINMVNPRTAKSIIIISPEDKSSDIYVIKTILALTNPQNRKVGKYHIVAEIKDKKNQNIANIIGKEEVTFVFSRDVASKIIVQTSRQSGLSIVYSEILGFEGSEIYFQPEPTLISKTFKDVLYAYEDSTVIGICYANGSIVLNPPMDTKIKEKDEIILISEDNSKIQLSTNIEFELKQNAIIKGNPEPLEPEKILILGWNQDAASVIQEIENYAISGSETKIIGDHPKFAEQISSLSGKIKNQKIISQNGDITDRIFLQSLEIQNYNHIIVLSYYDIFDLEKADAITLFTLLQLRDLATHLGIKFNIVSQMMDVNNKKLAEISKADDYIISEQLLSLLMSQLSENKKLNDVFEELFNAEGCEIYLKPVEKYVDVEKEINFYTLVEAASIQNEVAIGYRQIGFAEDEKKNYGVVINPKKTEKISLKKGDKLIVIAENE